MMGNTVIVGGGTAGLAAAYTLEQAGADYTILEKREFSGGRIYGSVREGLTLDLGAQFMFSRYYTLFDLLDKMGVRDQLVSWKPTIGILRDGEFYYVGMDMKDNLKHLKETLNARKYLSASGKLNAVKLGLDFARIGRKLDFDDPLKAIELDDVSFADYTRRKFGDEVLEYLQQPVVSALTLGQPEEVSAAYGMALGWYGARGLWTFKKGIGFLAESLKSRVKEVRLNTSVKRIVLEGRKVKGVEVESGGKTETIEAENVICCTLAGEAADVLPGLPAEMLDVLSSVRYSACTHVMLGVPGRPLGRLYALVGPRKEGFSHAGITENAVKAPGYAPPDKGIVHVYTFADHARRMLDMTDDEVRDLILGEIRRMVPTFPDPLFCEIFRWPQAVCLSRPGQIRDVQKLKVALRDYRGLYLAGEYFAMPSVEGALTSGVKAAERLLY
jgi:protoporphyrinogen/coproporphyrinogen III oxidase